MANLSPELIDRITREVLTVLRERGLVADQQGGQRSQARSPQPRRSSGMANAYGGPTSRPRPGTWQPQPRANVQPPIGICTGDYSKFPELAGRLYGQSQNQGQPQQSPPPRSTGAGGTPPLTPTSSVGRPLVTTTTYTPPAAAAPIHASSPLPLVGIVTASQLQEAMQAAPDGVARVAQDARLSPLANDLARQHPEKVQRVDARRQAAAATPAGGAAGQAAPWLWWIDGQCPAVANIVQRRSAQLRNTTTTGGALGLSRVIRDLAGNVKSGQVAGGLLFVRNASRAMCFANRCPSLRAVVGTCFEAVEQGIDDLGANVLVLEYPYQGPRAMDAMVDRIMAAPPRVPPAVERELADLHRCG